MKTKTALSKEQIEVIRFAKKVAKAMKEIASSNVFFIMQQAYGEDVMYDYGIVEKKFDEVINTKFP